MPIQQQIGSRVAGGWVLPMLERLASKRALGHPERGIERILQGKQTGRVVVRLPA